MILFQPSFTEIFRKPPAQLVVFFRKKAAWKISPTLPALSDCDGWIKINKERKASH